MRRASWLRGKLAIVRPFSSILDSRSTPQVIPARKKPQVPRRPKGKPLSKQQRRDKTKIGCGLFSHATY
jgi:hypothetical protein